MHKATRRFEYACWCRKNHNTLSWPCQKIRKFQTDENRELSWKLSREKSRKKEENRQVRDLIYWYHLRRVSWKLNFAQVVSTNSHKFSGLGLKPPFAYGLMCIILQNWKLGLNLSVRSVTNRIWGQRKSAPIVHIIFEANPMARLYTISHLRPHPSASHTSHFIFKTTKHNITIYNTIFTTIKISFP